MSSLSSWQYALLACVTLAVVFCSWYFLPKWMANRGDPKGLAREDKLRSSLTALVTAGAIVIGVFVTIYQFRVTQQGQDANQQTQNRQFADNQRTLIANQTIEVDNEVTTLFLESIKILENTSRNQTDRAGAIYAMQKAMEHDPQFHYAVIRTLIALIRDERSVKAGRTCDDLTPVNQNPEVQAALDVIGNRDRFRSTEDDHLLNFSQLCLLGATFNKMHFENADFHESDLRRTSFEGAWVSAANFSSSNMDYWKIPWIDPQDLTAKGFSDMLQYQPYRRWQILTLFTAAHAEGAIFNGACLRGVGFVGAHLEQASFDDASLSWSDFSNSSGLQPQSSFAKSCAPLGALHLPPGMEIAKCITSRTDGDHIKIQVEKGRQVTCFPALQPGESFVK